MGFFDGYSGYGLDSADLAFAWTFATIGASIPDTVPSGYGSGVFVAPASPNFASTPNQSNWSGDLVRAEGTNGQQAWAVFMQFSRSGDTGTDILVSNRESLEGQGFSFGISEANVPFIYTNVEGKADMRDFNNIKLGASNTICLSRGGNTITLSVYHPSGGYVKSQTILSPSQGLGEGPVLFGADPFLTGTMPESSFLGVMKECAMYNGGMVKEIRDGILHSGFQGYTESAIIQGAISNYSALGAVSMGPMVSFEKANLVANESNSEFYTYERSNLDVARIFADGVEDTGASIDSDGAFTFSSFAPSKAIYDIYVTGSDPAFGSEASPSGAINFSAHRPANSFYGSGSGIRLEKDKEYFEASSKDLFYGKLLGGIEPNSNNILCRASST